MSISVLDLNDPEWDSVTADLPDCDVFATAAYHAANTPPGATALGFIYREADAILFHQVLKTAIAWLPGAYDLETAYGYGGTASTSRESGFLERAWRAWREWCTRHCVVAEFLRCHPLTNNHTLFDVYASTWIDRRTVVVPLDRDHDEIWSRHQGRHRTAVRHAKKAGITVTVETLAVAATEFHAIYSQTMTRLAASDSYYFSLSSLETLATMGEDAEVVWASSGQNRLAGALLLYGRDYAHYHLSGSTDEGRRAYATNAAVDAAWRRAKQRGKKALHLGGGRTRAEDDALLKFKFSISPDCAVYRIGSRIHDPKRYAELKQIWSRNKGSEPPPNKVLFWR